MSEDVKLQVVSEMKTAPLGLFSIQLDESTDVASCAQLICFARYIHDREFKEDFLFCLPLQTTTRGIDVFEKVNEFFIDNGLVWENLCGVCTDGAPAMLGRHSGFQARVRTQVPEVLSLHCMIHRHALAAKTLPPLLLDVMSGVIKLVNYIKSSSLNTRLFRELCKYLDASSETLLFHTEVRWLSRGNVVKRVFELRAEIQEFILQKNKQDFMLHFNIVEQSLKLAYLVDIFSQLNRLNLSMQGIENTILDFVDKVNAFIMKLELWSGQISKGKLDQFHTLNALTTEKKTVLDVETKEVILVHLRALQKEFLSYFEDVNDRDFKFVRNPFKVDFNSIPEAEQEEFIELINDSNAKDLFAEVHLISFWCKMVNAYPKVSKLAIRLLLPFPSTYLCESGFSTLFHIKTKHRNRLSVQDDMRCAIAKTSPDIKKLAALKQSQPSH